MEGIITALGTAFSSISGDVMDVAAVAVPVAAGIMGVFLAVKIGLRFFKSIAK